MHHMFGKRNDAMQRPEVIEKMRATSLNKTAEEKAAIREKKRATFRNRTTEQREQFHSRYAATRTKNKAASC
jgi:hypothetical protein